VHTSPLTQQQRAFDKVEIPLRGTVNTWLIQKSIIQNFEIFKISVLTYVPIKKNSCSSTCYFKKP
jgi:hypothetical protein